MTDSQENKFTMCLTVKSVVEDNALIWADDAPFTASFTFFTTNVAQIKVQRDIQEGANGSSAKDKEAKRVKLTDQAFYILTRIQSMASAKGNVELRESVRFNKSSFDRRRDTNLTGLCGVVLKLAKDNAAALVEFKVTDVLITALDTMILSYTKAISGPRSSKLEVKMATEALVVLFAANTDVLIERLDKDITVFKESHFDFYSKYKHARKTIGTGVSKKAIKGSITDSADGKPLAKVAVTITNVLPDVVLPSNVTPINLKRKTGDKGGFQQTNLVDGSYLLTVTKLGYVTQMLTVNVVGGETTVVKVVLVRV